MSRVFTCGLILATSLVLLACDSGGERSAEDISGTWRGTVDRQGTEYTVVIELRQTQIGQTSNPVNGNGEVRSSDDSFPFSVSNGTFLPSSNDVSLPQQYEGGRPGQIDGTVADNLNSMTVTIIGGPVSFNGEELTLSRDG